jgi:sugar phosphate isomerase/epimerase
VPPEERSSVDAARKLGEEFNRAGEAARTRGLTFAYHNHDYEFAPLGSTTCYDVLLATCDPKLVEFELDLFWITKAGKDPLTYLAQQPGRFPMVHVKDMAADGAMVDVGAGTIDFAKIFAAANGGIRHYFVEHDNPADPFGSIAASYAALAAL